MTWRLWRALRDPNQSHPIFQRTMTVYQPLVPPAYFWILQVFLAPLVFFPFLIFPSTAYGLIWAYNISDEIAGAQRRGTFDLLALLPGGALTAIWMMSAGYLHRDQSLYRIHQPGLWIMRLMLAALTLSILLPAGAASAGSPYQPIFYGALAALFIDHYQAVVMSLLIAMLVPGWRQDRFTLRLTAAGLFLLAEVGTIFVTVMVGVLMLRLLGESGGLWVTVGTLVFFALLREAIVALLWHRLTRHAEPEDLARLRVG
ncbi:MAG: hypothetical protein OHK0046_40660 [Anaerolineae bacterium]